MNKRRLALASAGAAPAEVQARRGYFFFDSSGARFSSSGSASSCGAFGTREGLKAIRDRTLGPKPTIKVAAGLAAGSATAHGYADVKISGTVDDQLEAIKNQLSELTKTVIAQDQQVRTLTKETKKGFELERSEREKSGQQIREAINANAPWEIAGAGLIALGIILSTVGAFLC
jgi:hypothetical protein